MLTRVRGSPQAAHSSSLDSWWCLQRNATAHRWHESPWPLGLFPAVLIPSSVFGSFQATKERLKVHAEGMLQCWQNCIREIGGSRGLVQFLSWGRPQCSSKCHQMFAFLGWQYVAPIEVRWVNTARNWYFPLTIETTCSVNHSGAMSKWGENPPRQDIS